MKKMLIFSGMIAIVLSAEATNAQIDSINWWANEPMQNSLDALNLDGSAGQYATLTSISELGAALKAAKTGVEVEKEASMLSRASKTIATLGMDALKFIKNSGLQMSKLSSDAVEAIKAGGKRVNALFSLAGKTAKEFGTSMTTAFSRLSTAVKKLGDSQEVGLFLLTATRYGPSATLELLESKLGVNALKAAYVAEKGGIDGLNAARTLIKAEDVILPVAQGVGALVEGGKELATAVRQGVQDLIAGEKTAQKVLSETAEVATKLGSQATAAATKLGSKAAGVVAEAATKLGSQAVGVASNIGSQAAETGRIVLEGAVGAETAASLEASAQAAVAGARSAVAGATEVAQKLYSGEKTITEVATGAAGAVTGAISGAASRAATAVTDRLWSLVPVIPY